MVPPPPPQGPLTIHRMDALNQTRVIEFVSLGLTENWVLEVLFSVAFSITYVLTLLGNTLIIVTIVFSLHLHTPMYFFLSNLSFIDICHSSVTVPKMLEGLLWRERWFPLTIALHSCSFYICLLVLRSFCWPSWLMIVMEPSVLCCTIPMWWTSGLCTARVSSLVGGYCSLSGTDLHDHSSTLLWVQNCWELLLQRALCHQAGVHSYVPHRNAHCV